MLKTGFRSEVALVGVGSEVRFKLLKICCLSFSTWNTLVICIQQKETQIIPEETLATGTLFLFVY